MRKLKSLIIFATCIHLSFSELSEKEGKFSLFSVVKFPNSECTTVDSDSSTTLNGVCTRKDECESNSGTPSGNCASGFGVCCFYKVDSCGSTVSQNITYIQNADFPTGTTTASQTCQYTIAGNEDICQIRLDFNSVTMAQPATTGTTIGTCSDEVKATSPTSFSPPTICGTLTGTHMYIETGRSSTAATLNVDTGTSSTFSRSWRIKVTMIECVNPNRAPTDCVQYYTGLAGQIESFNNNDVMIRNQNYMICIRQEEGFCSFELSETNSGTPDSFDLDDGATALIGSDCTTPAWIEVPIGSSKTTDRYCGALLNENNDATSSGVISSNDVPFRIGVVALAANQQTSPGGFDLKYIQRGCNNAM